MHGVTAFEKHGERHARPVETRAGRATIPRIDIRDDDVPEVVNVIAEPGRDMVLVFPDDTILAGRSRKAGFSGGNGRFADQRFALEEIGALFADMDHDFGLTGDTIAAVPRIGHGRGSGRRTGRARSRRDFRATRQEGEERKCERATDQDMTGHKDAHSNTFPWLFNTKHSPVTTRPDPWFAFEKRNGPSVILAQDARS
jgi:hypothetical protein